MKKYFVVTGGAGFIGTNLISALNKRYPDKTIISVDSYFSGKKSNHIKSKFIKYIRGDILNIHKILKKYKKNIEAIFHFGEFSRISESFKLQDICFKSNLAGTYNVINFCLQNKIKIIYSATSANFGHSRKDSNLSPYAFSKFHNVNTIINMSRWFGLDYKVLYFYNVYGSRQIKNGNMSTVIGIFEKCYLNKLPIPVVKPGSQRRNFTHIDDTILYIIKAYIDRSNKHFLIYNKESYSILNVAKMFSKKIKFLKKRKGERFKSSIVNKINNEKVKIYISRYSLKDYISKFKDKNN